MRRIAKGRWHQHYLLVVLWVTAVVVVLGWNVVVTHAAEEGAFAADEPSSQKKNGVANNEKQQQEEHTVCATTTDDDVTADENDASNDVNKKQHWKKKNDDDDALSMLWKKLPRNKNGVYLFESLRFLQQIVRQQQQAANNNKYPIFWVALLTDDASCRQHSETLRQLLDEAAPQLLLQNKNIRVAQIAVDNNNTRTITMTRPKSGSRLTLELPVHQRLSWFRHTNTLPISWNTPVYSPMPQRWRRQSRNTLIIWSIPRPSFRTLFPQTTKTTTNSTMLPWHRTRFWKRNRVPLTI